MRIPAILEGYCLSICSSDFSDWIWRTVSNRHGGGYMLAGEYEIFEFNLGNTFNYCDMATMICPRPFMDEELGHRGDIFSKLSAAQWGQVELLYELVRLEDRLGLSFFPSEPTPDNAPIARHFTFCRSIWSMRRGNRTPDHSPATHYSGLESASEPPRRGHIDGLRESGGGIDRLCSVVVLLHFERDFAAADFAALRSRPRASAQCPCPDIPVAQSNPRYSRSVEPRTSRTRESRSPARPPRRRDTPKRPSSSGAFAARNRDPVLPSPTAASHPPSDPSHRR